jgi:hypothetical protein
LDRTELNKREEEAVSSNVCGFPIIKIPARPDKRRDKNDWIKRSGCKGRGKGEFTGSGGIAGGGGGAIVLVYS